MLLLNLATLSLLAVAIPPPLEQIRALRAEHAVIETGLANTSIQRLVLSTIGNSGWTFLGIGFGGYASNVITHTKNADLAPALMMSAGGTMVLADIVMTFFLYPDTNAKTERLGTIDKEVDAVLAAAPVAVAPVAVPVLVPTATAAIEPATPITPVIKRGAK